LSLDEFHKRTEKDGYRPDLDWQFAPGPKGDGLSFGAISEDVASESGLAAISIRISHGEHRGPTNGYGIRHILLGHGEELAKNDWYSVQDFLLYVIDNFDAICADERPDRWHLVRRASNPQDHHLIVVIEQHSSGEFYKIITGWLREGNRRLKNTVVWECRDHSPRPG
jgi:hypothetical protein